MKKESKKENEELKAEVEKEFHLERMILFSDAVFAIVITLMAIEIKIPESSATKLNQEELLNALSILRPYLIAYSISFIFIGVVWYKHLQLFSYLKSYDSGLVFHNLLLLFFIGFFPFAAALVSRGVIDSTIPFFVYMSVIFGCLCALLLLQHYILFRKPELRNQYDTGTLLIDYKKRKIVVIGFGLVILLISILNYAISDPETKRYIMLMPVVVPLLIKISTRFTKPKTQ